MSKLSQITLVISVFLSLTIMSSVSGQDAITTENETVSVNFPDTITFELDVSAESNIEKGTLIYGTNGRSCQDVGSKQKIEFDAANDVELEWEWELKRSGSIPPGAEVWWEWEVEDENGNVVTTERQFRTINDERFTWRSAESNGVSVNWVSGDTAFGNSILKIADDSLNLISRDMGVDRPDTIHLWVYPSSDDVQEALVYSPEWAGGVAFPDYGITILGIAPDQDRWKNQVVPHELAHLVVGELMFNCYGVGLPTWLNEGLARYAETETDQRDLDLLQMVLEEDELPPLPSLANGFSAYGASAAVSYTQSYVVVKHLIDEYGPEQMRELLNTVDSGKRIDTALIEVYGFDTAGLDAEWRQTTGYEATPTLESDAIAIDETPTAVPTLSLVNPLESSPTETPVPSTNTPAPATETAEPTATMNPTETPAPTGTEVAMVATAPVEPQASAAIEPLNNSPNRLWLILGAIGGLGLIGSLIYLFRQRRTQ